MHGPQTGAWLFPWSGSQQIDEKIPATFSGANAKLRTQAGK